jgi:probable rRNA maturation factor
MNKIKHTVNRILFLNELGFKKKNFYFLNLIFVEDNKIKQLNKMYRKINKATDVLTFISKSKNNEINDEVYCDIFFSAETIKKDSKNNLINFYDHLTHLFIHCFLHVNGYDHKTNIDFLKMKNLEKKILSKLEIKNPYTL